jgi:hypothetical protein
VHLIPIVTAANPIIATGFGSTKISHSMTKQSLAAAPPIGIVPEVAKSVYDVSGSETDVNQTGSREGVTFDTAGLKHHYAPIDSYEGKHRYDPDFVWDPKEEKKVVRKVSQLVTLKKKR